MRLITTLTTEYSLVLMSALLLLHVVSSRRHRRSLVTHQPTLMPNPSPVDAIAEQPSLLVETIRRVPEKAISH